MRNRISTGRLVFKFSTMIDQDIKTSSNEEMRFDCPGCGEELDIESLLCKYGPEGLYDLAERLKSAADEDVSDAMGNG